MYCEKGILHRDISKGNIMRTSTADGNGVWGRLIDFDAAVFTFRVDDHTHDAQTVSTCTDLYRFALSHSSTQGTRPYLSINVLSNYELSGEHDYADDIESVFWVLMSIVMTRERPGKSWSEHSTVLAELAHANPKEAMRAKTKFLRTVIPTTGYLAPYWSHEPFVSFLNAFRVWCEERHYERIIPQLYDATAFREPTLAQRIASHPPFKEEDPEALYTPEVKSIIAQKTRRAAPHYKAVMQLFEVAMKAAEDIDKEFGTEGRDVKDKLSTVPAEGPTGRLSTAPAAPENIESGQVLGKRKKSKGGAGSRKRVKPTQSTSPPDPPPTNALRH